MMKATHQSGKVITNLNPDDPNSPYYQLDKRVWSFSPMSPTPPSPSLMTITTAHGTFLDYYNSEADLEGLTVSPKGNLQRL